jgi:hypothetical protein
MDIYTQRAWNLGLRAKDSLSSRPRSGAELSGSGIDEGVLILWSARVPTRYEELTQSPDCRSHRLLVGSENHHGQMICLRIPKTA